MIIEKCIDYYYYNQESFVKLINSQKNPFVKNLRKKIFSTIQGWTIPYIPPHFELHCVNEFFSYQKDDEIPQKYYICRNGWIPIDQSVFTFLEKELTGESYPSYQSEKETTLKLNDYCYPTFGSKLNECLYNFSFQFVYTLFYTYFSIRFYPTLSSDAFDEIMDNCNYFNDVKANSFLSKTFDYPLAFRLCGIPTNMMLYQIIGL